VCDLIRGQIDRAIESDSIEVLITALGAVARQRAQAETESVKAYLFQELIREIDRPAMRRKVWSWIRLCAARPETEAREIACALLDTFWKDRRKDVERLTLNLARDENWEVRQYAASTMARIVRSNFRLYFRYLRRWSMHPDPSVRRQVIVAAAAVADPDHPEWAKPLLDLFGPHLSERDPFVRKNLGPFALGQGMLVAYPEATIERFHEWVMTDNELILWNIGMAFTTAAAPLHWEGALEILRVLAADRRRFVWSVAAMALRNLAQHRPRPVQPVLKRWMDDPTLRVAVATALNPSVR